MRVELVHHSGCRFAQATHELLQECLGDRVEMDFDTARRLFTLICALHITS